MARIELDMESDLPPERILGALTDFSDRRPDLWPGLRREAYKVYATGDTWAEIREGSGGNVWARGRYDWSTPGQVTWTVQESGFSTPGDFVTAIASPRTGGGSRIHVIWQRRGRNLFGKLIVGLIAATRAAPVKRSVQAGLDAIKAQGEVSPGST